MTFVRQDVATANAALSPVCRNRPLLPRLRTLKTIPGLPPTGSDEKTAGCPRRSRRCFLGVLAAKNEMNAAAPENRLYRTCHVRDPAWPLLGVAPPAPVVSNPE